MKVKIQNDKSALTYLLENGDEKLLDEYLKSFHKKDQDLIEWRDASGRSLLHRAAKIGNTKIIASLIKLGVDLDVVDFKGNTATHYSILKEDNNEAIRLFINSGANLDIKDKTGETALSLAMGFSDNQIVYDMLKSGANPNIQNNSGCTPLYGAFITGKSEVIQHLVNAGGDPNIKNNEGYTPLNLAVNIASYISDPEENKNLYEEINKSVKALINSGANLDIQDNNGNTPLHNAALNDNYEAMKDLIKAGANQHTKNNEGITPLQIATDTHILAAFVMNFMSDKTVNKYNDCKNKLLEVFIKSGANLDIQDQYGATAMHRVIREGNTKALEMLIEAKADLNIKDNEGHTAMHLAIQNKNIDALKTLTGDNNLDLKQITANILKKAINEEDLRTIEVVLDSNKELKEEFITHTGRTWLSYAVSKDKANAAAYMIEQGFQPQRTWTDVINKMSALDLEKTPSEVAKGIGGETLTIYKERNSMERVEKVNSSPEKKRFAEIVKRDSSVINRTIPSK